MSKKLSIHSAISEKETSTNAVLCGRPFHRRSLQAVVIAKVRGACVYGGNRLWEY